MATIIISQFYLCYNTFQFLLYHLRVEYYCCVQIWQPRIQTILQHGPYYFVCSMSVTNVYIYMCGSHRGSTPHDSTHKSLHYILGSLEPSAHGGVTRHQPQLIPLGGDQCRAHFARSTKNLQHFCHHHYNVREGRNLMEQTVRQTGISRQTDRHYSGKSLTKI